jgi:hypothetical protein
MLEHLCNGAPAEQVVQQLRAASEDTLATDAGLQVLNGFRPAQLCPLLSGTPQLDCALLQPPDPDAVCRLKVLHSKPS